MNGTLESLKELVKSFNDADLDSNTEVVIAPPALYCQQFSQMALLCIIDPRFLTLFFGGAGAGFISVI